MISFICVALGGFFGAICRFYISIQFRLSYIGTLIVNMTGSTLIIFLFFYLINGKLSHNLWLFLGVGFCGAYTTFSTFSYETIQLFIHKQYKTALAYLLMSILFPFMTLISIIIIIK